MDKKYRLLKDLPGVKAGTVSDINELWIRFANGEESALFSQDRIDEYPDWFEEVKDEKNPEYYSETKFKKGDILYGKGYSKVVYLGKGRSNCNALFKGVVIDYPAGDYNSGEIRDDFFRGCFKKWDQ